MRSSKHRDLQNAGKQYFTSKGVVVLHRTFGEDCQQLLHCFDRLSPTGSRS